MKRHSRGALLLGSVPFAAMCFSVAAWDRVHPMVLGLPFNFFWLLSWMVLTPVCLRIAYHLETSQAAAPSAPPRDESRTQ